MQNKLQRTKEENDYLMAVLFWMVAAGSFCVSTWIKFDFVAFLFVCVACFLGMKLGASIKIFSSIREKNKKEEIPNAK